MNITHFKCIACIDVRDRFAVRRAGDTIETGSEYNCRRACRIYNDHEQKYGRTPDYYVTLNPRYEGFKELMEFARLTSNARGDTLEQDLLRLMNTRYRTPGEA